MSKVGKWNQYTVAQLQDAGSLLVEDGNHGEYRPRPHEFSSVGVSFIRATDLGAGYVQFGSASRINDSARTRIRKGIGAGGDVILSHKGTVGKIAFAPLDCEPFVCSPQTTFWRSLDSGVIDRRYLYYFLCSDDFRRQLDARKGETDMADYVSLTAQRELKLCLPPIKEQRSIGYILGALDDGIDLNRRMNQTLEAMARAIFQSWFVDFDPVVAKAAGRQPFGMSADVAALFPDRFVDSGTGPIPCGWRLARLDDLVVLQRGYDLPATGRTPGIYPVLSAGGPTGTHCEFKVRGPGVTTGRSGQLGAVYFVHEDFWPLNTSLYVKEFRASSPLHAYFLLQTLDFDSFNAGSAVPTLNRNHVHNLPVVVPPEKLLAHFNGFGEPLFNLSRNNDAESRTLASLRDTLLPKLMSGELRVRDAEN